MNKLSHYASVIILVCLSSFVSAQSKFSVGIKAGPNFANINTEKSASANYESRAGFHAGAFALVRVNSVGIQPELLFSQQGSNAKYSGSPDLKSNFSYVNIPVIVKLYTVGGINLQVGPQIGFLMSARQEFNTANGNIAEQDVKDDFKKTDFSLAFGAGWDLPFGLTIDGRYNLGLSDINNTTAGKVKNQVWQISVGYKLFTIGE